MILSAKAILFDNDGVLVDSNAAVDAAWGTWAKEFDADAFSISNHLGTRSEDLVSQLVSPELFDRALARINELEQESATETVALAGAKNLLDSIPLERWTICTSANPQLGRARILAAGLLLPETLVTGGDVEKGKPAADPYLLGAKRLGFDPGDCVVFEDADAGVKSALAAGVGFVIGVSVRGLATDADIVIEDLVGISFDGTKLVIPDEKILRR